MDDLRTRLAELDRIAVPDLWPEIERRASAQEEHRITARTRWAARPSTPTRRITSMPSLSRLVAVGAIAAISTGLLLAGPFQTAQPDGEAAPGPASPTSEPASDGSIVWDSGSVRLEADALEIKAGDKVFTGEGPYAVQSDPGDPTRRTLEVEWTEDGLEQRLYLYFAADGLDWWITEVRTRDGYPDADWITYEGSFLAATPRGESYEGDLHLKGGDGRVPGELTITGLRLTAFAPGTGPAALGDCEYVRASVRADDARPLDEGQPLAGSGIEEMTPEEAEALLRDVGLCFTFRYEYPTTVDPSQSGVYSERWCSAPPSGDVDAVLYLPSGEVVVFVHEERVMPLREQPPEGWGCPAG